MNNNDFTNDLARAENEGYGLGVCYKSINKHQSRIRSALLIVDVQCDFCPGGSLAVNNADCIVPRINDYIHYFFQRKLPILASRDWHPSETGHFKEFGGRWPRHCVKNTRGARFYPDMELPKETIIISKGMDPKEDCYSAFHGITDKGSSLHHVLHKLGVRQLYICGLATDYCVKATVLDAIQNSLQVYILIDAIQGVNLRSRDSDLALFSMVTHGVEVLKFNDLKVKIF